MKSKSIIVHSTTSLIYMSRFSRRPELKDFVNPEHSVLNISTAKLVFCKENENLYSAMKLFLKGYRKLPVVEGKDCAGMLTLTDVLDFLNSGRNSHGEGLSVKVGEAMKRDIYSIQSRENIKNVLEFFKKHGRGAYPVLRGRRLKAIVTESDFVQQIHIPLNIDIEKVMTRKPIYINCRHSISDAAKMMCKGGFRRLPVVKGGEVIGIITPSDIISHLNEKGDFSLRNEKASVKEIMERRVESLSPEKDIYEAVKIMNLRGIGGVLVTEEDKLTGIITERDIIELLV